MSNIATEIADIQRELLAMKAGFSGDYNTFTGQTVTIQNFILTPTRPMIVTVDFEYREFPEIIITGFSIPPGTVYTGYQQRYNLYQWYVPYNVAFGNMKFECVLFSENPPTLFTLQEVS